MMIVYDLKTNSESEPLGLDKKPYFSWKLKSAERGAGQSAYRIVVSENEDFSDIVWDSAKVISDNSVNIGYTGEDIKPTTKYYWYVSVWDENGEEYKSEPTSFETGLMGTDKTVWSGAEWIGSPCKAVNTAGLDKYRISGYFMSEQGNKIGIVFAARDKDNYILLETDIKEKLLKAYEYSDSAWSGAYNDYTTNKPYIKVLGNENGYIIADDVLNKINRFSLTVDKGNVSFAINEVNIINNEELIPSEKPFFPFRRFMFCWGFKQLGSKAVYKNITVENMQGDMPVILQKSDFSDSESVIAALGRVENNSLIVENEFNIISAVPTVNLRKAFEAQKKIKSARVYSSARGFYDLYINGEKANDDFYNPGFTDYRKRIQYQTYDVTDLIKGGTNTIGAVVSKGYYTGYVGYNISMIYGKRNSFIAKLVITYEDNSQDTVVTDDTWQFTDKGPVVDADYLQGERYDARLEFDWNDLSDNRWTKCGVHEWTTEVKPTNGELSGEKFELSAQLGAGAKIERVLTPISEPTEAPKGHFVYDMGQNMVGTVRVKVKGERGKSIKLRFGEMSYKNGEVYLQNLRSAYNTDVYILKGEGTEEFTASLTQHGFRYIEITGEGYELTKQMLDEMIVSVEGLVLANTNVKTGGFECSNSLVNKLQSNIEWGQRGNSLLVYTDCPQRNERMGWTGDAQVFAKTAAYNMDVRTFMDKWLLDVRDAQLMYNKNGAVPDTAPLGGDNRPDGCAGWGDASVIVPWQMYLAYGDKRILEENYEMMADWISYQSRPDRQNYGVRTVDGVEVPENSDLATILFIQCQQRRGDHLSFDLSTPYIYSATAYAANVAETMAKIADVLGKDADAKMYRERFENIKKAFNEAWVREDGSIAYWGEMSERTPQNTPSVAPDGSETRYTYYSDLEGSEHHPSQTAYALAINFGLVPKDKMAHTRECYKKAIERSGGNLSVGFLGISHLAPSLSKAGLDDVAFSLLENEGNPSWLYSVKNGATTIWERWDSYVSETDTFGAVSMNSFNHYSYGAIGEWMFSDIAGINTSQKKGEAGYKHIILTPKTGGSLTYARAKYESVYGQIVSDWEISGSSMTYKCAVPANTTAIVYLPTGHDKSVSEKGGFVGCEYVGAENGKVVYKLVSGEYEFTFDLK